MTLQDLHGGGLPRPIRPKKREDLAARHAKIDPPNRFKPAVVHAEARNLDHRLGESQP